MHAIFNVAPLLVLQIYVIFFSNIPESHSWFDILSLATSLYMDTLPVIIIVVNKTSVAKFFRTLFPFFEVILDKADLAF